MFLQGLEVHHLTFTCYPVHEVHFGPQAGAQLRGALWDVLRPLIGDTVLLDRLMNLETPDGARGSNPARPFSIRPPIDTRAESDRLYTANETFSFGISIFGTVIDLFPYIVQGIDHMGQTGVGYGRGKFTLGAVYAINPMTGQHQPLLVERKITGLPAIPVTFEQVAAAARARPLDSITLQFITPTQLTGSHKRLLSQPEFSYLIPRLIERCQSIAENYAPIATPQSEWRDEHLRLRDLAATVTLSAHQMRWINVRSGSRRTNSGKKISGFVGEATFTGHLKPFMSWLLWGQSLQVGKNTVKGCGWYAIV